MFFCVILHAHIGYTQLQLPVYTDYLTNNYFLVHPSMAGAQLEGLKVRMTHRTQWTGVQGAPSLQTINAHGRIGLKSGLGITFYNDKNGFHSQIGASATYAHHINLTLGNSEIHQISFGLSAGALNSTHDQTNFALDIGDPVLSGTKEKANGFNMDMGLSYFRYNFYTHLTVRNLILKAQNISDNISLDKAKKIIVNTGYFFEINQNLQIEPSLMYQAVEYAKIPAIDTNLSLHQKIRNNNFLLGLSYRFGTIPNANNYTGNNFNQKHQQLTFISGVQIRKFSFYYSYTQSFEQIQVSPFNGHQFTLGFDIFSDKYLYFPVRGIF